MGDIYGNAFVVIAVTKAQDGSLGCYSQTEPEFLATAIPGYQDVYVRQELPKFPSLWHERTKNKSSYPVLNRAWCYQELRLSSRVLHFCAQEVVWECRSKMRSESGRNDEDFDHGTCYARKEHSEVPCWNLTENPTKLWYRTVQEYSGLDLSFASDEMAALAALTQRMERLRVDDRFLAGLWEKTLILDLLWTATGIPEQGRPDVVRAPLWSWTSVHGQATWNPWIKSTLSSICIVDVHYVCVGPSHMGDISEAKVTLRAPLIRAGKLIAKFLKNRDRPEYSRLERGDGKPTDGTLTPDTDAPGPLDEIRVSDFIPDYRIDPAFGPGSPTDSDVFIIPMGAAVVRRHAGLCVRRSQDHSTYERFGYAWLEHRISMGTIWNKDHAKQFCILSTAILKGLSYFDITLV